MAPQADPVSGTFAVRVGLSDPPEPMRLGATVTGQVQLGAAAGFSIPASALTQADRQPAVWIVDPASGTVSLRNVEVARHDLAAALVTQGLETGDIVVTAGVQGFDVRTRRSACSESTLMSGFNLSAWALRQRSLVIYLMIAVDVRRRSFLFATGSKRGSLPSPSRR